MNGNLTIAAYDWVIPALTIWREARGESYEAKCGVAAVIRNRVLDPRWPSTPAAVCLQKAQFSAFNKSDPNATKFPDPKTETDYYAWETCCEAWEESGADSTGGANHYHSRMAKPPKWAREDAIVARIGAFTFYRL